MSPDPALRRLKRTLLNGLFILAPLGLTVIMLAWLVSLVDSLLAPLINYDNWDRDSLEYLSGGCGISNSRYKANETKRNKSDSHFFGQILLETSIGFSLRRPSFEN